MEDFQKFTSQGLRVMKQDTFNIIRYYKACSKPGASNLDLTLKLLDVTMT